MPNLNTGITVQQLRRRKGWQREVLENSLLEYAPVVHRLERGDFLPRLEAIYEVLDTLETPTDEFIYSDLEDQDMATHALRHNLLSALERKNLEEALPIYKQMAAIEGFKDYQVNRQFLLSQEARILEQQDQPASKIMTLAIQGLNETYPNLDSTSPGTAVLVYEEPELFHTLARQHARQGDYPTAKRILIDTINSLQRLPTGERVRDRRITPMVQTLAEYQSITQDYEGLHKTCALGFDLASLRSAGRRVPEFLGHMATVLFKQGNKKDAVLQLRGAYALHMLMGDKDSANEALDRAVNEFGEGFETHGIEKLDVSPAAPVSFARGDIPACKTIGQFIRILRKKAGLTLIELSQGICDSSNLSKIETADNKSMPSNLFHIEPLLQRLGRDPHLYCNFFMRDDDFVAKELHDEIHGLLNRGKYKQADKALAKLKTYKAYSKKATKANLQFIRRAEASIFAHNNDYENPEVEVKLLDALRLTCPQFDENKIVGLPLTIDEVLLISTLAGHYVNLGTEEQLIRALNIYKALIQNINRRYVDEREKVRLYIPVMFRLCLCLNQLKLYNETLKVAADAIEFCQSRGRLSPLTELTYVMAYAMHELGCKEESQPYFIMAYYGFCAFRDYGRGRFMTIARDTIHENFDIVLD